MTRDELNAKYCMDISLAQYKTKKSLLNEANEKESKNYKTHQWKSAFVNEIKKLIPSFNGSVGEVERIVMQARVAGLTPKDAAKRVKEYYSKMKPGTNGYETLKKLTSKYGSVPRSKDPQERHQNVIKIRNLAARI